MREVLPKDNRIDSSRAGVVGRSYGGYMTLTLASRYPELWSAAVDMFGPYDLLTFMERIPETWKPYFSIAVGDPLKDREFLIERSPRTSWIRLPAHRWSSRVKRPAGSNASQDVVASPQRGKSVGIPDVENEATTF
jgi:pimeloyl-ACP methyl ester carboxylesterase